MSTKVKIILAVAILLSAFAFGRWSKPEKIKIEKQIVEVEKKTTKSDKDGKKDTETHIIEHPDGTKETIITTHAEWEKHHSTSDDSAKSNTEKKEITSSQSKVTISALGGVIISNPTPVYGLSVSKPILGPITVGAWGLNNGIVGASIGLTF